MESAKAPEPTAERPVVTVPDHLREQFEDIATHHPEGIWAGDLVSKDHRSQLVDLGFVWKDAKGMNRLTDRGVDAARSMGFFPATFFGMEDAALNLIVRRLAERDGDLQDTTRRLAEEGHFEVAQELLKHVVREEALASASRLYREYIRSGAEEEKRERVHKIIEDIARRARSSYIGSTDATSHARAVVDEAGNAGGDDSPKPHAPRVEIRAFLKVRSAWTGEWVPNLQAESWFPVCHAIVFHDRYPRIGEEVTVTVRGESRRVRVTRKDSSIGIVIVEAHEIVGASA